MSCAKGGSKALVVNPLKVKHRISTWPRNSLPRYTPQSLEGRDSDYCAPVFTVHSCQSEGKPVCYQQMKNRKMWSVYTVMKRRQRTLAVQCGDSLLPPKGA